MERIRAIVAVVLAGVLAGVATASLAQGAGDEASDRAIRAGVPRELASAVVQRGASAEVVEQSLGVLAEAASQGLPLAPVADKVLEGLAKGVPPSRLLPAAREVTGRLGAARAALGEARLPPTEHAAAVVLAAEALRRGATPEAVSSLATAARSDGGSRRLPPALRELARLADRRAASPLAGTALGTMAARGYPDSALGSIAAQVDELVEEGGDPAELLAEVEDRARAGRPVDGLVDPFSERPGAVARDPAAVRAREAAGPRDATVRGAGRHGLSPLERPDAAGSLNPGNDEALRRGKRKGSRHDR